MHKARISPDTEKHRVLHVRGLRLYRMRALSFLSQGDCLLVSILFPFRDIPEHAYAVMPEQSFLGDAFYAVLYDIISIDIRDKCIRHVFCHLPQKPDSSDSDVGLAQNLSVGAKEWNRATCGVVNLYRAARLVCG